MDRIGIQNHFILQFLNRFMHPGTDLENRRRIALLILLSSVGIVFLTIFGTLALLERNYLIVYGDFITAATLAANLYMTQKFKKYRLNIVIGLGIVTVLYAGLYVSGANYGAASLWYFSYPLIACYLIGASQGRLASILLLIPFFLLMLIGGSTDFLYDYKIEVELRFLGAYLVVTYFSYLFEKMGEENRLELHEINRSLEQIIDERTSELQEKNRQLVAEIEERHRAEKEKMMLLAQMQHAQKLESIGTLASGVAHEINNPLTGMINYADLIQGKVEDDTLKEYAAGIMEEGHRVAKIVRNLLTFARDDKDDFTSSYLSDSIQAATSLIGAVMRKDQIEFDMNIQSELKPIKCRTQQIQQVMMNLLTNARDAVNARYQGWNQNKKINISLTSVTLEGQPYQRITVEDYGIGVPTGVVDRIFDPFFTTKDRTKGTGLGLSISYGIVTEHKGNMWMESETNEYTRFHVDLPETMNKE